MAGDALLDTNIVIALLGNDPIVVAPISSAPSVYLPITVIGELYFGARKSARAAANLQRIDDLVARSHALNSDTDTARLYGQIKDTLRIQGTPIPENDIWIAAASIQHGIPLLSRDLHFRHVSGLTLEMC